MNITNSHRVAIFTKFIGPTDRRGARIKAHTKQGMYSVSIFMHWNYGLDVNENHMAAARELCEKMDWSGELICGGYENGYVFVFNADSEKGE